MSLLSKHRTPWEILSNIIKFCLEPRTITALFYEMQTSYGVLKRTVGLAQQFKLIENKANKYQTTEKGINFMNRWDELQNFLKEE